jgi:hypothetical protein
MTARTATADDFNAMPLHAACLYDIADVSLLPPPLEGYALDLSDAAVRRMAIGVSVLSVACSVGGLWLAALAG